MPPKKATSPIIFQKLTQLLEHPGIFSEIRHIELENEGLHKVFGIVNDKYFEEDGDSEKTAKDTFALNVFKAYQTFKPVKTKAQDAQAQAQLLCWSPSTNLCRFKKHCKFQFVDEDEETGEVTMSFVNVKKSKNEETGKWVFEDEEVSAATGVSSYDAEFDLACQLLNSDDFRNQYIEWVKNGKRGTHVFKEKVEGEEDTFDFTPKAEKTNDKEWDKVEDGEQGEWGKKLAEFCEKYGLPEPGYFMAPETHTGPMKVLCKLALVAKDKNKEEACKQINEILVKICTERQEIHDAKAAELAKERDAKKAELDIKLAAEKEARVERLKVAQAEMAAKREAKKAELAERNAEKRKLKEEVNEDLLADLGDLAVFDQASLKAQYADELEQFPILKLNEFVRKEYPGQKIVFKDCGGAPDSGYKTAACLGSVKVLGSAKTKKEGKQIAAQALLMALRAGADTEIEQPKVEVVKTEVNPFVATENTAPSNFTEVNEPGNTLQPFTLPPGVNAIQYVSQAAQLFGQELDWDTDGGALGDKPNQKIFTTECTFGILTSTGSGANKKEAKNQAAALMIPKFREKFGCPDEFRKNKKRAKVQ